jgi:hypothetical protein
MISNKSCTTHELFCLATAPTPLIYDVPVKSEKEILRLGSAWLTTGRSGQAGIVLSFELGDGTKENVVVPATAKRHPLKVGTDMERPLSICFCRLFCLYIFMFSATYFGAGLPDDESV